MYVYVLIYPPHPRLVLDLFSQDRLIGKGTTQRVARRSDFPLFELISHYHRTSYVQFVAFRLRARCLFERKVRCFVFSSRSLSPSILPQHQSFSSFSPPFAFVQFSFLPIFFFFFFFILMLVRLDPTCFATFNSIYGPSSAPPGGRSTLFSTGQGLCGCTTPDVIEMLWCRVR
jgi:hypothetical protein